MYDGIFVVFDMNENEVIIGLFAILGSLWDFFTVSVLARTCKSACNRVECIHTEEGPP